MSLTKGVIHGVASMVLVVLGAVLANAIKENVGVFEQLSDAMVQLLVDIGNLPIAEEVAAIVVPVGLLMGLWVFVYEVKQVTT